MDDPELTPTERAAVVTWWFAHGDGMTAADVARLTGLSVHGARAMLARLARKIPIYRTDAGVWEVCALGEARQS